MIKFFNTLTGKVEEFKTIEPGKVKLYTCGPTVYDYAHIGNFRAYVFEDLLKRFLKYMGYEVLHIMNITDVDDKTIKGAKTRGMTLKKYTEMYIDAFFKDIETLNILKADCYPRATEHIPEMVEMIKVLLQKGYAYQRNGSIYFNIKKFPDYGKLSKIELSELKPGIRIEADEYEKDSVYDFALWKEKKEGEPFWATELGEGRPGWHIECSAMSIKYLGQTFDIHCGGVDNIFPHHENEIAQSEAFSGVKFVNYWLHCHHLIVEGEKMSKSKGNQFTLRDILEKNADAMALRFLLLSTHYRKTLNFTLKALEQAHSSLKRIRDFIYELKNSSFKEGKNKIVSKLIEETKEKFIAGLSNDLNISLALTSLFTMIKKANKLISKEKFYAQDAKALLGFIQSLDNILGLIPSWPKEDEISQEIKEKIALREKARKEKDYELADKIREELRKEGIILEDTREGVRWKISKR